MELTVEYIPALIVAKNKEGNYTKISEANKDEIYYCPVCNGEVKARAIGSDKVQPHFYHITESSCNNESILHWMFKNWLFESGSIFKVDKEEFIVTNFEMEKLIETPFGEYRPDLFIQTDKEDFFFEINYSSGKDKTFSDKWTYLNKRVVEVNVKELINCELYDEIPKFKTIFEDGKYTKEYKTYERKDKYSEFKNYVIGVNKEEQIKQLVSYYDWFWRDIKNGSNEDIKLCLNEMKYDDAVVCTRFLKKIKCHDKFDVCKEEMMDRRQNLLNDILNDSDYCIKLNKLSPQRYTVLIYKTILGTMVGEESKIIKSIDGLFSYIELKEAIDWCLKNAQKSVENVESIVKKANEIKIEDMEFEKFITVHGENNAKKKEYTVNLIINAYSDYFKQWFRVYNGSYYASKENNSKIKREVKSKILEKEKEEKIKVEINDRYNKLKEELKDFLKDIEEGFCLIFDDKRKTIELQYKDYGEIKTYESYDLVNVSKQEINSDIELFKKSFFVVDEVVKEINNCKNEFWNAEIKPNREHLIIKIKPRGLTYFNCGYISIMCDSLTKEKVKKYVLEEMKSIIDGYYNYRNNHKEKYIIIKTRKES